MTPLRAELSLAAPVSTGQSREELIAFADYCATRIARDLLVDSWDLFLVGGIDGSATAVVRAHVGVTTVEASASDCDPAHAIWNAMCQVEQPLRYAASYAKLAS